MVRAISLDMGSSQIKVGLLNEYGHIEVQGHEVSPQLKGRGPIRVANPQIFLKKATQLLQQCSAPKGTPLGISSQRSSFVLWNARTGRTLTPLISWQDLRAAAWCTAHSDIAAEVTARTGLPLSPHYAASKLALLLETDADLRRTASRGQLRFGTLETYLIWNWTGGTVHHTDLSMAARTQLFDRELQDWCPRLLELFGVPAGILPQIVKTPFAYENSTQYPIQATAADQAACSLPIFMVEPGVAFINAGTATFLMRAVAGAPPKGVLAALLPGVGDHAATSIWEAPVNAGARVLRGFKLQTEMIRQAEDPFPGCFGIADSAGLAAPYWRPEMGEVFSPEARALDFDSRQRVMFESLLFRVHEVLDLLFADKKPDKVVLAGGLSSRYDFSQTLASLLDVPLYVLREKEMSLWGVSWLATQASHTPKFHQKLLQRRFADTYLMAKYPSWKAWMAQVLEQDGQS